MKEGRPMLFLSLAKQMDIYTIYKKSESLYIRPTFVFSFCPGKCCISHWSPFTFHHLKSSTSFHWSVNDAKCPSLFRVETEINQIEAQMTWWPISTGTAHR